MGINLDYQHVREFLQSASIEGGTISSNDFTTLEIDTPEGSVCIGLTVDEEPQRRAFNLQSGVKITFFNMNDALETVGLTPEVVGLNTEVDETIGGAGTNDEALFSIFYDDESNSVGFELGNTIENTAWGTEIMALLRGDNQPLEVRHGTLVFLFNPEFNEWNVSPDFTPVDENEELAVNTCLERIRENSIFLINKNPLP